MRATPLAFPREAGLIYCDDQYLFGNDLLVAPLVDEGPERSVSFPSGRWVNAWTGEIVEGPAIRKVQADYKNIPVYLRAGAMLPVHLNTGLQWGESMTAGKVAALIVTAPIKEETARFWENQDSAATAISSPTPSGFTLTLDGRADTRYLLLYGTGVTGIEVNGKPLPKLEEKQRQELPPGWFYDGTRIVVRLPHGTKRTLVFNTV